MVRKPKSLFATIYTIVSLLLCASVVLAELPPKKSIPQEIPQKIRVLIENLYLESVFDRKAAIEKIGEFGKDASCALPYLLPLLKDESWVIRKAAIMTLEKIGDESVIEPLIRVNEEDDVPAVARAARLAVARMKEKLNQPKDQ